jgi:cytochrome c553
MADYKSGARATSVPQRAPVRLMIATAKGATDAEVQEAAAFFSALELPANITVIEADVVPRSYVFGWHMAALTSGATETLGERILEVPNNLEHFESRDGRARFTAYVPRGSIEKGRLLAAGDTSSGRPPCAVCHGLDLKGAGPIPGLAGRSPSYIVRQLYDFKHGARAGAWSGLMAPAVEHLATDDMIALAAYAASLSPH